MVGSALALLLVMTTAGQAAAPGPVPTGRRYGLERAVKLHFEVPTSVGVIKGTVKIVRLEARGLDGGKMDLRGTIDPNSVDVGDHVLSDHVARWVLSGEAGPIIFGSSTRLAPLAQQGQVDNPNAGLFGVGLYLDARRGGRYLELRYRFKADQNGGVLGLLAQVPLKELGIKPPKHPFIEVKGPITLRAEVNLVRR